MKRLIAPLLAFLVGTLVVAGVAAPPVQTIVASLSVPSAGTILDTNAPASTIPVVNAAHQYTYQTLPAAFVPTPAATATVVGWNGGWTAPSPIATATNGVTVALYGGQSAGLTPIGPYSVNANNSNATATPLPVSAAALAGMLSGSNGCPPQATSFVGTSSDTSGTYTTPTCNGVTATVLIVQLVGGGGGGGGGGATAGNGGTGDASTFGTSLYNVAAGTGGGGNSGGPGTGGAVTTCSTGAVVSAAGANGNYGTDNISGTTYGNGGAGAPSWFGGAGGGGASTNGGTIGLTGGGGGGGAVSSAGTTNSDGAGGGSGGFCWGIITSPAASYSYTAGKYGSAGTAGTNGSAGGHGGGGTINVVASWGTL